MILNFVAFLYRTLSCIWSECLPESERSHWNWWENMNVIGDIQVRFLDRSSYCSSNKCCRIYIQDHNYKWRRNHPRIQLRKTFQRSQSWYLCHLPMLYKRICCALVKHEAPDRNGSPHRSSLSAESAFLSGMAMSTAIYVKDNNLGWLTKALICLIQNCRIDRKCRTQ